MRIDWLVLARYAAPPKFGTMNILGAGLDTLLLSDAQFPLTLQAYLAMRLVASVSEWSTSHDLAILVTDPNGRTQIGFTQILQPLASSRRDDRDDVGLLLPGRCQWKAHGEGRFTLAVVLDAQQHRELGIDVALA